MSHGTRLDSSTGRHTGAGVICSAMVATLHPAPDASAEGSASAEETLAPELFAPALGVPMAALVRGAVRHHDEMPRPGADDVIAAGAAVLLVARDLADLVAVHDRPRGRSRAADRCGGRQVFERRALVLPGHQLFAFTKSTTCGISCAALSRGLSFRDRSNEWPASSKGTYVARVASFFRTPESTAGSANGSFVPCRNSIGIVRPYRCSSRGWSDRPGACSG